MHGSAAPLPKRAACAALDLIILLVVLTVLVIIITGGGTTHLAGWAIRSRGTDNPIWIVTALVLLRYVLGDCPILGARRWPIASVLQRGIAVVVRFPSAAEERFRRPVVALAVLAVAVFCVRVSLAWASPGFFSGDDVEIHEMTLGALLGKPWPVWNLRCAFFPMTFVYPAQWLAMQAGWSSTEAFVLAGRTAVALVSTAAVPLAWYVARHLAPAEPRLAAVTVCLLAMNKLQMSFGSSELPRPVSTVFVLAAFFCATKGTAIRSELATPLLLLAVLHDAGGWRLSRSDEGVRLGEHLRATGMTGLAVQDPWRLGGRPYLWPLEPVTEMSSETLTNEVALAAALKPANLVALRSRVARSVGDPVLQAHGYTRDPAWHGEDYVLYGRAR